MKKSDIVLIISVVLIVVIAFFIGTGDKFEKVVLKGDAGYSKIDYEEYNELLESNDYFILNVVRTGCSYCEKFEPVAEEVSKELSIPFYYIDIADLEEDELEEFTNSNSFLRDNEWGTPTTLILSKEKVIGANQGYIENEKLEKFIKQYVKIDGEE